MSLYKFGSQFTFSNAGYASPRGPEGVPTPAQIISDYPTAASQLSDVVGRTPILWERDTPEAADVQEFMSPGFRYLDEAMKMYWSDIRIPTKDSSRFVTTKIAGGDKSLQIWVEELKNGRIKLPVMSISRGGHEYNPLKYSPAYAPIRKTFLDRNKTRLRLSYRPAPYLVSYTLSIWAEHKTDVEYALHQILTRFNPLAEFVADDNDTSGAVQLRYGGMNDVSDKEAGADQLALIKYELTTTAEAWLSLPDKIMPAIVGQVGSVILGGPERAAISEPYSRFSLEGITYGQQ